MRQLFLTTRFEYSLRTVRKKIVVAALFVVPCFVLAFQGVITTTASILGNSRNPAEVGRALAFEPANPELHRTLGIERLYSLQDASPAKGLAQLRQAADLGPNRALCWSDIANACAALHDESCAGAATLRALSLQPMMPRLHWTAASWYLNAGRTDAAEDRLRQLLRLSPVSYAEPVFSLCLRSGLDSQTVMDKVMPAGRPPDLTLQYAYFLVSRRQFNTASGVWKETIADGSPFPFSDAEPYFTALIRARQYGQAWSAWKDLEDRGVLKAGNASDRDNLVFNGRFENAPLDTGFDWMWGEETFVSVDFLASQGYRGARALRLVFTADRNRDYEPVVQFVPVTPGRNYLLKAYVRSAGITSDSGPRLRVIDPFDLKALSAASPTTVGTTPWHPIQLGFSTGLETHFIQLSVWRPQGRSFPYGITGTFWLDDVSLKPTGTSAN